MKKCLLVGCGAEIGSNLLLQHHPQKDGFSITDVITNPPVIDKHYPELRPIDGIVARLALAQPGILSSINIIDENILQIRGHTIRFHFCEVRNTFPNLSNFFDIAFLATNKTDISENSPLVLELKKRSRTILGVSESDSLPSIYSCLSDLSNKEIPTIERKIIDGGIYCLGSCQTNGMHASLRIMIEALRPLKLTAQNILSIETDIVHPDTPNGVLGTRSFEGRMQDARDNIRPSFSQITQSQNKVMPWAPLINTVSIRVPVHAPGYQINRFIVQDNCLLNIDNIQKAIYSIHTQFNHIVKSSHIPLGSRAYSNDRQCATVLNDSNHLIISRPSYLANQGLSEIIIQSFVSNTIGYSELVISTARSISFNQPIATFRKL